MNRDFLKWFSGKSLEKALVAADLLEQSIAQDCWIPGASRKCRAAFDKINVAHKLVTALKKNNLELDRLGVPNGQSQYDPQYRDTANMGRAIDYCLRFGYSALHEEVDFNTARAAANGNQLLLNAINGAEQVIKDFAEVYAIMDRFDAMRPIPVFTMMNASRTVSGTMKAMQAVSVEVCPMEWETVEFLNTKGQTCYKKVGKLLWPEGTRHNTSPRGRVGSNCEACGHKISNGLNWVPLVLTTEKNETKSLWVGRDCCKTLFGIDMKGDLEIRED